jgi:hypothetical protein
MKKFSDLTEEDKIRFSKFAKTFVNEFINIDDKNYIKICRNPNNCHRTNIRVDKDYLINTLNYNWKKIGNQSNRLFNISVDILEDLFEFSIDESYQLLFGFIYPEIYDRFYKPLEPDYINESKNRTNKYKLNKKEIEYLISLYEDSGIIDRDYALEELQSLVSHLNGLNNSLKLYRIICADSEEDIDGVNIGSHYTLNRRNLIKNHYDRGSIQSHCYGDRIFLLTVESTKSNIDVMETLSNNILFPIEEEITLKNKGKGSVILSIEEL